MAISDIKEYAHLTPEDVEELGARAGRDQGRHRGVPRRARRPLHPHGPSSCSAGWPQAAESRCSPAETSSRGRRAPACSPLAKIIENMELGHNITHGQWDWMNDPEIHSTEWEWDTTSPTVHWKKSHNFIHHKYTNIVGLDDDIGYGIMRLTRDQRWERWMIGNPIYNFLLGTLFEWGVAAARAGDHEVPQGREVDGRGAQGPARSSARRSASRSARTTSSSPRSTGPAWKHTLGANAVANLIRNYWSYMVIFCGHFPDGAEKFTQEEYETETQAEWYLRQMLGSANFNAGPLMAFMSGNLCYQIEHHLFPDLPSNRYAEIGERVRALCDKYDLPYTTGSAWLRQYSQSFWTIAQAGTAQQVSEGDARRCAGNPLRAEVPHPRGSPRDLRRRSRDREAPRTAHGAARIRNS